ncbi:MAG TPA: hypothetical protein VHP14_24495 [Anaerolineales bacterium]|nr:hypothetical protein [Anaerolineales bacterium]
MPLYSIIPLGIGAVMLWAVIMIFGLLQFTNCPAWGFVQSTPNSDVRIIGALKEKVYLQAGDGTIHCNAQNQWQNCVMSTFVLSHKDAPVWLHPYFSSVPEHASVTQLTRMGDVSGNSYYALLDNNQIWACQTDFFSELKHILTSRAVLWLILPAGIGLWCAAVVLKIFAEEASPTWWDFGGRGTKVK